MRWFLLGGSHVEYAKVSRKRHQESEIQFDNLSSACSYRTGSVMDVLLLLFYGL
jgi:hypothetical protein